MNVKATSFEVTHMKRVFSRLEVGRGVRPSSGSDMLFLHLWFLVLPTLTLQVHSSSLCKCMPWDSCWPDLNIWQRFNASLGGKLLSPRPWAWPCHQPGYDASACSAARLHQTNAFRRSNSVGAMQYPNWEFGLHSPGCPLGSSNATDLTPCFQGQVSTYAVNASTVSDVQSAINFASHYNLRLVIKSTGHDWLGRSTAIGSLCIWLRHLTGLSMQNSFMPQGCMSGVIASQVVVVESGVTWDQVYRFLDRRGRVAVGSMGTSVGTAGGFVQGGGHSPLSRKFGLAADNVLEFQVVTADGQLRVANRCQNRDLFWALRGGGGGTFGVVISAAYQTFPALANGVVHVDYGAASMDAESQRDLIRRFIQLTPPMDEAGLAGYFHIFTNALTFRFFMPNGTVPAVEAAIDPLVSYVESRPRLANAYYNVTAYPSFLSWQQGYQCPGNPGVCTDRTGTPERLATRFMPRAIIQNSSELLTSTLMEILYGRGLSPIFGLFVVGREVSRVVPGLNSVSRVWRESLWLMSLPRTWNETTSAEEQMEITSYTTNTNELLRRITPGGGSYTNEADYSEPDWQQSFFGENYEVLSSIKWKWDPDGLFMCWKCVGSETWMEQCLPR